MGRMGSTAVVVLGCRMGGTLARRARAGADAWHRSGADVVVACGGRTWLHDGHRVMEADWLAARLVELGIPQSRVVRERCSYTTRDNARFATQMLVRRAIEDVTLVTCEWHLSRALAHFEREGMRVRSWPASGGPTGALTRTYRRAREWVASRLDGAAR